MDVTQKLEVFRELMLSDGPIYSWTYDPSGNLLFSNCPDQPVLGTAFELSGCLKQMLQIAKEQSMPTFLSAQAGIIWGAAYEKKDAQLLRCHMIGPVRYTDTSFDAVLTELKEMGIHNYSVAWLHSFREAYERIPISQHMQFSRDLKMLHYSVTGESIDVSDIYFSYIQDSPLPRKKPTKDRRRVYQSEQAMLEMVKNGDLNYKKALGDSMKVSNGVEITAKDAIRRARISTVVFCTIVCRAAMEGGMNPEEAYSLGDAYIQSALDARTISETTSICMTMYDDFIRRVHRLKENPHYSEPIRRCCDYIAMNLDRNLHAQELADLVGYSVTYFTRRFREETGLGISDYVKKARIDRAKLLLKTSDDSILEISEALGFTTRNYFTKCFREVTGITPIEYRHSEL